MGCAVRLSAGMGMILRIAMAGNVASATRSGEAMSAPAVRVAPVGPGTYTEEDAVIEIARAVVANRGAGVGRVVVVAVGANRGRSTDVDGDLRIGLWRRDQKGE